jgi:DNA-binding transcriptional regulator of glucitol operon
MKVTRIEVVLASIVFCIALGGASGQVAFSQTLAGDSQQAGSLNVHPAAGPNRPPNVPDGYVITPFGYFHASCVQSLAKGERLLADGRLQHADGNIEPNVAVCNYPHYTRGGIPLTAETNNAPEINGWIESASITTGSATKSYGALIAVWTVPPQPSANDGQVLYFFPGFEDINNVQSILQPVLAWFQKEWTLASWNCCLNGITTNSPAVGVTPGDKIYGSVTSSCPPGTLSCATWNVLSLDLSTGESTTLSNTPSDGQVFNWAFGGVLEPYYVIKCDDYPPNRQLDFDAITVFNQDLHPVSSPKWTGSANSTATPQCGYAVKETPHEVTLDY